jgi:hypothetical protein
MGNGACQSSQNCVAAWFPSVSCILNRASVIHMFLKKTRKVDEAANFVFVQLIKQEPGVYDKRHPGYAKDVKTDLTWEEFIMRRSLDTG